MGRHKLHYVRLVAPDGTALLPWPWRECEHCHGESSSHVRLDSIRGYVCPPCDVALSAMAAALEDATFVAEIEADIAMFFEL